MSELQKEIARNLKREWLVYKRENNTNQRNFAEIKLSMTQANFSSLINGNIKLTIERIAFIANALNIKPSELLPNNFKSSIEVEKSKQKIEFLERENDVLKNKLNEIHLVLHHETK